MGSTHGLQVVRRLPPPLPPRPDPNILAGGGKRKPTPPPLARSSPPLGTVSPSIARRQMMLFGGDDRQTVAARDTGFDRRVDYRPVKPSTDIKQDEQINRTPPLETNLDSNPSTTRVTALNQSKTSPVVWRRVTPRPLLETNLDNKVVPPRRSPHPSLPSLNHAGVPRRKAPATPDGKHGNKKQTNSSGEEEQLSATSSENHVIRKQNGASVEEMSSAISSGHIVIHEQTNSKVPTTATSGDHLVIRKQSSSSMEEGVGSRNEMCPVETSRSPSTTEDTSKNRLQIASKTPTTPTLEYNTLQSSPHPLEKDSTPLDHSTPIRNGLSPENLDIRSGMTPISNRLENISSPISKHLWKNSRAESSPTNPLSDQDKLSVHETSPTLDRRVASVNRLTSPMPYQIRAVQNRAYHLQSTPVPSVNSLSNNLHSRASAPGAAGLQGLPPLPKSLSGVNLLLDSSPPPPAPTRPMRLPPPPPPPTGGTPHSSSSSSTPSSSSRKTSPITSTLDTKLAILRKEMYGLRQLDLTLLSQLWTLNESIQEFRALQDALSPQSDLEETEDNYLYGN
ncbi:hypothetical protein WDU94_015444 [Cyamophila willieti]